LIGELWDHRGLVLMIARRQFQLRYRQSAVGVIWAVAPTIGTLFAATLVFDRVVKVDTGSVPYSLFALSALAPWTFFANSLTAGVPSVANAQTMITRMLFPRASLPIATVGTSLIDLAASTGVFLVFLLLTRTPLPATAVWFPALVGVELALITGVVLLGSALNVFARDIKLMVPTATQLWLLLTPVMYPLDSVPERIRPLFLLNPMTGIVESFRMVLVYGRPPDPALLAPSIIEAGVFFAAGLWYFGATQRRFADVI
jgi:homopolymeric O-antigen transport system permease protein